MAKKPGMKNNTFLLGIAAVLGLGIAGVVLVLFLNLVQTETYYILNEDVPSRAQVTPEMLAPVTVSEGGAPEAAIGLDEVQAGGIFTSHPLLAGDILTASNVGTREDISVGIPDEWVITNFSVGADSAVGGRIQRGYYFDMLVTDESGSFYPFVNILALDTTVDLAGASSADAVNTEEATAGQTTQYVVGMSPQNAGKLQDVMAKYSGNVRLVISPRQNEYERPQLADYEGVFSYTAGDAPLNLGEGTDYTFTALERDKFGRLTEELNNCGDGNAVIPCEDGEESSTGDTDASQDTGTTEGTEVQTPTDSGTPAP